LPLPLTGFDVFDEIRTHAEFANIPVIAVSATDVESVLQKLKEKGFSGFISKPISLRNFPQKVAAAINGEEVWSF
jgi:two-component system cell cycle response regulator DivK